LLKEKETAQNREVTNLGTKRAQTVIEKGMEHERRGRAETIEQRPRSSRVGGDLAEGGGRETWGKREG